MKPSPRALVLALILVVLVTIALLVHRSSTGGELTVPGSATPRTQEADVDRLPPGH